MNKIFLIIILSLNLFSLGSVAQNKGNYSNIPADHKSLVNKVISELDLSLDSDFPKVRKKIYDYLGYGMKSEWYSMWRSNTTPSKARFKNSSTRFVDITVINKTFAINVTFIYFKDVHQIYVSTVENHSTTYQGALNRYNEFKAKPSQMVKYNTDNSALLKKDGYMEKILFLVKEPSGFVQYLNSDIFDINTSGLK